MSAHGNSVPRQAVLRFPAALIKLQLFLHSRWQITKACYLPDTDQLVLIIASTELPEFPPGFDIWEMDGVLHTEEGAITGCTWKLKE